MSIKSHFASFSIGILTGIYIIKIQEPTIKHNIHNLKRQTINTVKKYETKS